MNPGPVEEVGHTARTFIDALKEQPLALVLAVVVLVVLMIFYITLNAIATQREREIGLLYADHKEVRDLLARCIVPTLPPKL